MNDELFEIFWSKYPRHVSKRSARKSWDKEVRNGADPLDILAGLERQLSELLSREAQFRPHPATWLNQARWEDEPSPPARAISTGSGLIDALLIGRMQ